LTKLTFVHVDAGFTHQCFENDNDDDEPIIPIAICAERAAKLRQLAKDNSGGRLVVSADYRKCDEPLAGSYFGPRCTKAEAELLHNQVLHDFRTTVGDAIRRRLMIDNDNDDDRRVAARYLRVIALTYFAMNTANELPAAMQAVLPVEMLLRVVEQSDDIDCCYDIITTLHYCKNSSVCGAALVRANNLTILPKTIATSKHAGNLVFVARCYRFFFLRFPRFVGLKTVALSLLFVVPRLSNHSGDLEATRALQTVINDTSWLHFNLSSEDTTPMVVRFYGM
jgi:hypothetical protein